jgi:hypothetical protein
VRDPKSDKVRALLRTLGASRKQILTSVLLEAGADPVPLRQQESGAVERPRGSVLPRI